MLPDVEPTALLEAFLTAHAAQNAVPMVLFPRGEELYHRLCDAPPAHPAWGRFLVALGQLAANELDDTAAASRYFLQALQGVEHHGDHESAVTAGFNQGVLMERRRRDAHALAAYKAAAVSGFRCGSITANTIRSAIAAVRLRFAEDEQLGDCAELAKQAWLAWLYLRSSNPSMIDEELHADCCRQMAALLLPEDNPGLLMEAWRHWPPASILCDNGHEIKDTDVMCRDALFTAAAEAAELYLQDEGSYPGAPYLLLRDAARRSFES